MNCAKRAGLYVIRHKIKSLILFLVLTVIAIFVLTGIAIQNSVKNAAKDVRASVSGKILLNIDMSPENMKTEQGQYGPMSYYAGDKVTGETVAAIKEISGVTGVNMTATNVVFAAAKNFEYLPAAFVMGTTPYGDSANMAVAMSSEKYSGFVNGKLTLEYGRHITDEDSHVILISDELAEYNDLQVGDILELYIDYAGMFPEMVIEVEIIGIFSGTEGMDDGALTTSMRAGNQGIIDFTTANEANMEEVPADLEIYVEDPVSIQNVYDRIANHPEIKGKTFMLTIDTQEYDVIANPLESLQDLVGTLMIAILIVSVAVLVLLFSIWIRGRIKETGILMSVGIGKGKIIGQFIMEAILIALFAFVTAYPASNAIADRTGEFIMEQAMESENLEDENETALQQGDYTSMMDGLSGKPSAENAIKQIDVVVTLDSLAWVYVIGTLIIICAVLMASYTIICLNPRDILAKMS